MHDAVLESLDSFPPLRESIERLNILCEAPEIDILAFAETIEADPMLYSDILRAVNAPAYGFRAEITSIRHALTLFGPSKIHGLALQSSLTQYADTDLRAYGITLQTWLLTMRLQQAFLFHILRSGGDPGAFIKLSGVMFILEIGKLAANYVLKQQGSPYRFRETDPYLLLEEERAVMGLSGDELAVQIFRNWHFESEFIELFRSSLHAERNPRHPHVTALLQLTRSLITVYGVRPLDEVDGIIARFGLNRADIAAAYAKIRLEFERPHLWVRCSS